MVWTSDKRQFFFDVTSRVSLWMMPEELCDNPLVEKIIENGPDGQGRGPQWWIQNIFRNMQRVVSKFSEKSLVYKPPASLYQRCLMCSGDIHSLYPLLDLPLLLFLSVHLVCVYFYLQVKREMLHLPSG